MRGLRVYSTILVSVLLVFFGVIYWPSFKNDKNETVSPTVRDQIQDLQLAENHFKKSEYDDVLKLILKHADSIGTSSDLGHEWLDLLIATSEKTFDVPQLVLIDEQYPESLKNNEKASLLAAESYIMNGQDQNYVQLRQQWVGRENYDDAWVLLDADYLLLKGQYDEGHEFLESKKLVGKEEAARLVRLALLNAIENPEKALSYLNEANALNPSDLDAYLYQIKLLEKERKDIEALNVYQKAILANPKSIFMHDQLAKFYIRHGQYKEAVHTWKKALNSASNENDSSKGEVLVNLIFFDRMQNSPKNEWNRYASSSGALKPIVSYLLNLKNNEFVNQEALSRISQEYIENEQALYWLFLLDVLKQNDKEKALSLIHENPFKDNSFNPLVEFAILQTLNFQTTGEFLAHDFSLNQSSTHPLLMSLTTSKTLPDDIYALLQSEEAFSAIFLAAGWTESALQLHKLDLIPDHFPSFVAIELTQALRKNRGDKEALAFASKQNQTLDLALAIQEMSARIALEDGNKTLAEKIYESISDKSYEAKSYLARKAFKENNFKLAEKLTKELLEKYPNNSLLLENLKKIQEKNV